MKNYTFNVLCKSGQWKETTIQALNFREARQLLDQFIADN